METKLMRRDSSDAMITRLYFGMLPVQILLFAMGVINSIVDGAMAGRFIDSASVGVVGLYFPMVNILNAAGSVMLGGSSVLCGKFLGRGDINSTRGLFSLNISVTFIIGALMTLISIAAPGSVASALGASDDLRSSLAVYITGYAVGIIPMLLAQQLASFLQMERQDRRGYAGIAGMIISNVTLDILFVGVLKMGVRGLALATAISNWVYFLILVPYYFTSAAQLRFSHKNILWKLLPKVCVIGLPGALLVFCLALRGMTLNRILLTYSGSDGLSAMSSFNMVNGIFMAYCLGSGNVIRMLISVFAGEEDKSLMRKVIKIAFTKGLALSFVVAAFVFIISPFLTGIFFPDSTSNVYRLAYQLFVIYSLCIPLIYICTVQTNYLQATGHNTYVSILSVFDGYISMVVPSMLLAPVYGAFGVWIANPIGVVLTILLTIGYTILFWGRIPRSIDEWMLLRPSFGVPAENCLDIYIRNIEDVEQSSDKVLAFCDSHNIESRAAYYSALCIEEMAGNVVRHGFALDSKSHSLYARVIFIRDTVMLRLKDDCKPFDPGEFISLLSGESKFANIGIRMISKLADSMEYQNLLGLNVLTVTIREKNLILNESSDYLLERRLRELDPDLHKVFTNTVFVSRHMLSHFKQLFPEYTDHSELHSMTVIDSCNRLIGPDQIGKLNKDEIFILLTACYLHDSGMGVSEKDFDEFKEKLGYKAYFKEHPGDTRADFIRAYHNEFSGLFIEKYAEVFDLPSEEYSYAVKQVSRGHRKVDLFDETEYPADYRLPNGSTVCLPYLASLLRLADEIDVVASRNPMVLYDIDLLTDEESIDENRKLEAVKAMTMTRSSFILYADTDDNKLSDSLVRMVAKMQNTLDYCRDVVGSRTDFRLTQKNVILAKYSESR